MHDLEPLADWFAFDDWPGPPCPICKKGSLTLPKPTIHETAASTRLREHDAWDAEWVSGYFTADLRCGRQQCHEVTIAVGEIRVRCVPRREQLDYVEEYLLRFTAPALPIVSVPRGCPEDVESRVAEAGVVIWADPSAAANRLRLTIEQILDQQGVPRHPDGARKDVPLKTHNRIDLLRKTNPGVAAILEAVKWIGNQGSHEDVLTTRDVLEGARLLEHAMRSLYDTSADEIDLRVRAINEAKGVRRPAGGDAPPEV